MVEEDHREQAERNLSAGKRVLGCGGVLFLIAAAGFAALAVGLQSKSMKDLIALGGIVGSFGGIIAIGLLYHGLREYLVARRTLRLMDEGEAVPPPSVVLAESDLSAFPLRNTEALSTYCASRVLMRDRLGKAAVVAILIGLMLLACPLIVFTVERSSAITPTDIAIMSALAVVGALILVAGLKIVVAPSPIDALAVGIVCAVLAVCSLALLLLHPIWGIVMPIVLAFFAITGFSLFASVSRAWRGRPKGTDKLALQELRQELRHQEITYETAQFVKMHQSVGAVWRCRLYRDVLFCISGHLTLVARREQVTVTCDESRLAAGETKRMPAQATVAGVQMTVQVSGAHLRRLRQWLSHAKADPPGSKDLGLQ